MLLVLGIGASCSDGDSPGREPKAAGRGSELQQEERIAIDVRVDGEWTTIHPTKSGLQDVARWFCAAEVREDDSSPCQSSPASGGYVLDSESDGIPTRGSLEASSASEHDCRDAACHARKENCAGALLEELAVSPVPREIRLTAPIGTQLLQLTPEEASGIPEAHTELRLGPALGSAGASALRAALEHYAESGKLAHIMRTTLPGSSIDAGAATSTCVEILEQAGPSSGWLKLYLSSLIEAATRHANVARQTTGQTKAAAMTRSLGADSPAVQSRKRWNSGPDSIVATARILGHGKLSPNASTVAPNLIEYIGATSFHKFFNPRTLPACPPKTGNVGLERAVATARALGLSPAVVSPSSQANFGDFIAKAYLEDQARLGAVTEPPASLDGVLGGLGISRADAELAESYLRHEAAAFGRTSIPRTTASVGGFDHIQRSYGTSPPKSLPPEVIAAHFLGDTDRDSLSLDDDDYGEGGALRALDQMRFSAYALESLAGSSAPELLGALGELKSALTQDLGGLRLEFGIGPAGSAGTVTEVTVKVHGSKSDGSFFAVQGIPALQCALSGAIDGAPCGESDSLLQQLEHESGSNPYAVGLQGDETYSKTFASMHQPSVSEPNGPITTRSISDSEAIYVLQRVDGVLNVLGGAVPKPGSLQGPISKSMLIPVGGIMQTQIARVIGPAEEDCSEPEESCIPGVSASLVPPLGSEIVGNETGTAYESGWKYYLEVARATADEADRLGEELVRTGLEIDERIDQSTRNLMDLCGADGRSCSSFKDTYVTLGDKKACLWIHNQKLCGGSETVPCPFIASDNEASCATEIASKFGGAVPAGLKPLDAVPLGMAPTPESLGDFPSCKIINELREGIDEPTQREKKIRELASSWTLALAASAAAGLKYTEAFADNYRLEYAGQTLFDTERHVRPSPNKDAKPPCTASAATSDDDSRFWGRKIACFVSGEPGRCSDDNIGKDGCSGNLGDDTYHVNAGQKTYWSFDTEPDALRNRWAWGFGHLRRSMATLGLITGQLGNTMTLARVLPAAMVPDWDTSQYRRNPATGPCEAAPGTFGDLAWIEHCTPPGCPSCRESVRCIQVTGKGSAIGDDARSTLGRPVNVNGFIGNFIAWSSRPEFAGDTPANTSFPWVCQPGGGGCLWMGGVDPQMVYCGIPDAEFGSAPSNWTNWGALLPSGCWSDDCQTASGWVGATVTNDIGATYGTEWDAALEEMWSVPSGNFCSEPPADDCQDPKKCWKSAIWRAFCRRLPDPGLDVLIQRPEFMQYAHFNGIEETGDTYVDAMTAGRWIQPIPGDSHTENWRHATVAYLYDMRDQPYLSHEHQRPLQYEINARGIVDAMDLLCHATRNQTGFVPDCTVLLSEGNELEDASLLEGYLNCVQQRIRAVGGAHVTGPVPMPIVDAFVRKMPIAGTTGLGGAYLEAMAEERSALESIAMHYDHIADALQRMGYLQAKLKNLKKAQEFDEEAAEYRALEDSLVHLASAMGSFAQALNMGTSMTGMASSGLNGAAGVAHIAACEAGIYADKLASYAERLNHQSELWDLLQSMRDNTVTARDSVRQLLVEIDTFTNAAAKVRLVQAKGDREVASATLADYWDCEDPAGCPIPYNTALRRTYNTKVIRYQNALERARRAAFVARRAIEVRFGVKLSRIYEPMSFVQAPNTWADGVCQMSGIKYDQIRDAGGSSESIDFSGGASGDDYADDYIGDYVSKLEDFVRSYPFDFPLMDSDDTAVLSLSEDLLKVSGQCFRPADNLLRWSSDFDQPTAWSIGDCGKNLPASDGGAAETWQGCLSIMSAESVDRSLLPASAKPFLVRNARCTPISGDHGAIPSLCPEDDDFLSSGALYQEFTIASSGMHRASVYLMQHSFGPVAIEVVRGDSEVLVSQTANADFIWMRNELPFLAAAGDRVKLVVKPSAHATTVPEVPDQWPGVYVAAAQVEWVPTEGLDTPGPATAFQRTTADRLVLDPVCHKFAGPELRRRFVRHCERICLSGVATECPTPEEQASATERCFREASITLPIEAVQQGALSGSGQLAAGNFNYRHNTVAVNIVGSGVRDCDTVPGSGCYQNAFVEYTLTHDGATKVSNWEGGFLNVDMPTARIEHGKAVAAERVITNPPSSSDSQLLEPFTKTDFRGRPIHGNYVLRIWESPGFDFDRVEDIQLVWRYHYWTRQDKLN